MIKVNKIAEIIEGFVRPVGKDRNTLTTLQNILCNMNSTDCPRKGFDWKISISLDANHKPNIDLNLPNIIDENYDLENPISFESGRLWYFMNYLFIPDRIPINGNDIEEINLRIKKIIFEENFEFTRLKALVSSYELAKKGLSENERKSIPDSVKLAVWARDMGKCSYCGSNKDLHFDHIIPVSLGGGNYIENLQVLCSVCNISKSNRLSLF